MSTNHPKSRPAKCMQMISAAMDSLCKGLTTSRRSSLPSLQPRYMILPANYLWKVKAGWMAIRERERERTTERRGEIQRMAIT